MAKNLSERIAERVKQKEKVTKADRNRAAVIAVQGDIAKALEDGWGIKVVWETLHDEGKIQFSYQTFRLYVNQIILKKESGMEESNVQQQVKLPEQDEKKKKIPGFQFEANAKKEDLI